jgi:hypothetical protein
MTWNETGRSTRALVLIMLSFLPAQARAPHATLPQAVVDARTIYLESGTNPTGLEYTAILELDKWGQFVLVEKRDTADLIMHLANGDTSLPKGYTLISLLDPKTGNLLWSDLEKTENSKVRNGHLLDGLRKAFDEYEKGRRS